jgi:hypothetical protein
MSLLKAQHTLHQMLCQKLVTAHQSALQGLQVIGAEVELQNLLEKLLQYYDLNKHKVKYFEF